MYTATRTLIAGGFLSVFILLACNPRPDCDPEAIGLSLEAVALPNCGGQDGSFSVQVNSSLAGSWRYQLEGGPFQDNNTFSGLAGGAYELTAANEAGCEVTEAISLAEAPLEVKATEILPSGCEEANGSLTLATPAAGLRFRLDGGPWQAGNQFSGLTSGTYVVEMENTAGCQAAAEVFVPTGISFEGHILPIIQTSCALDDGCHGANSPHPVKLVTYADISGLADRIKARTGRRSMPPGGRTISEEAIEQIACWVDDGAENN